MMSGLVALASVTMSPTALGSEASSASATLQQELMGIIDRRKARIDALEAPSAADYVDYCQFLSELNYYELPIYEVLNERSEECARVLTERFPEHPKSLQFTLDKTWSDFDEDFDRIVSTGLVDWTDEDKQALFQLAAARLDNDTKAAAYALILDDQHRSFHTYWKALKYFKDNYPADVPATALAELRSLATSGYEKKLYFDEFRSVDAQVVQHFFDQMEDDDNDVSDGMKLVLYASRNDLESVTRLIEESEATYDLLNAVDSLFSDPPGELSSDIRTALYALYTQESWARDPLLYVWYTLSKTGDEALGWPPLKNLIITVALIIGLFLLPLLIVMPVHYFGLIRQQWRQPYAPIFPGFTLKSFVMIAGGLVIIDAFLAQYFTGANPFESFIEPVFYSEIDADTNANTNLADLLIYGTVLQLALILLVTHVRLPGLLWSVERASVGRILGLTFFGVIACLITSRIVNAFNLVGFANVASNTLAIGEYITQVIEQHGLAVSLLIVAIMGPVFEELLCRAIILNSTQRHLGFWAANIFQALVFMGLHLDTELYIYYFVFGCVAGLLYRSTRTLAAPILMHVVINTLAVVSLWGVIQLQSETPPAERDGVVAGSAMESCLEFEGSEPYAAFLDCWLASEQGDIRGANSAVGFLFSQYMPADHSDWALQLLLENEDSASGRSYYLIHHIYQNSRAHIDPLLARQYLHKSADAGDPVAQSELASVQLFIDTPPSADTVDSAIALLEKAIETGYRPARNQLAWFYATTGNQAYRNGDEAIALMQPLLPAETMPYGWVDTLACAHAAAEEFSVAVELQEQVVDQASRESNESELAELEQRLELFRQRQSYFSDEY